MNLTNLYTKYVLPILQKQSNDVATPEVETAPARGKTRAKRVLPEETAPVVEEQPKEKPKKTARGKAKAEVAEPSSSMPVEADVVVLIDKEEPKQKKRSRKTDIVEPTPVEVEERQPEVKVEARAKSADKVVPKRGKRAAAAEPQEEAPSRRVSTVVEHSRDILLSEAPRDPSSLSNEELIKYIEGITGKAVDRSFHIPVCILYHLLYHELEDRAYIEV